MTTSTTNHNSEDKISRQDIYTRVTDKIVADLEQGVRPWMKPWNAEHAAGKITRPLRHNGTPYSGINILALWMAASANGFAAPIWMTYRESLELGAHVRKGGKGVLTEFGNGHQLFARWPEIKEEIEGGLREKLTAQIPDGMFGRLTQIRKVLKHWSGKGDLNPRPSPWQGDALPLSYSRSFGNFELILVVTLEAVKQHRIEYNDLFFFKFSKV